VTKDLVQQRHSLGIGGPTFRPNTRLTYTVTFAVQGPDKELLAPQTNQPVEGLQLSRRMCCWRKRTKRISCGSKWPANLVSITMRRLTRLK